MRLAMNNLSVNEHIIEIECEIEDTYLEIEWFMRKKHVIKDAATLEDVEKEIIKATDRLAGQLLAHKVQQALESPKLKEEVPELVKAYPKKMKNQGPREVKIRPLRGEPVLVQPSYYSPKEKKKGKKKRVGFYPSLVLLGIHDYCSPCLSSEISALSTVVGSFNEAQQLLKERGVDLDVKTIQRVTRGFAERAKCSQRAQGCLFKERVNGRQQFSVKKISLYSQGNAGMSKIIFRKGIVLLRIILKLDFYTRGVLCFSMHFKKHLQFNSFIVKCVSPGVIV
jgi:hypothetical protein